MKEQQNKEIRQEKKNYYRKIPTWLTWLMLLVLCGICVFIAIWIKDNTKEYTATDKFVRYSMGSKFFYDENLVLKRKDDLTYIDAEGTVESDGTPLVYEGQYKYLLPVDMAFLDPNSDVGAKRVNYFSTTLYNEDEKKVTIACSDKETDVYSGFLYDGNGTYIFIEEVELAIGKMKYNLSPMSYVRIFYKDSIEIFNLAKDEYQYIELNGYNDVIAVTKTDYSINLGTNVMTVEDVPRILFSNMDVMGVLE